MQVNAEKSAVGPDSSAITIAVDSVGNPITSPQILITTAQTTVSAKSGQTVILGGLITNEQQEITSRIPNLADIPVLGRLFRFDSVTNVRTELLIIMTPYIIESEEQTEWINTRETERMSWCLGDIVNIHGPIPVSGQLEFNGTTPLIFPDLQPGAPVQQPTPAEPAPPGYGPAPPSPLPNQPSFGAAPRPGPVEPAHLVPQTIQTAAPPAGTNSAYQPWRSPAPVAAAPQPYAAPAAPNYGPPPVAPVGYQQAVR